MRIVLLILLPALLWARPITRDQLVTAVRTSPEVSRNANGLLVLKIRRHEGRQHRPRKDPQDQIGVDVISSMGKGQGGSYTRFKAQALGPNLVKFTDAFNVSTYCKVKWNLRKMNPVELLQICEEVAGELLDMSSILLIENDDSRIAEAVLDEKREMLDFLAGKDAIFLPVIFDHPVLCQKAMGVIEAHLFDYQFPLDIDFAVVDPSSVQDVAFGTLKYVYNLLSSLASVTEVKSPAFVLIESYQNLIHKLFQLLYLPDANERRAVCVVLINLYNAHESLRKPLVALLGIKYAEMAEYFATDYAFIYHDILTIHRGFFLHAKDLHKDGKLIVKLEGLFMKWTLPLLEHPDLADYGDQWAFCAIEMGMAQDDIFDQIQVHAFVAHPSRSHYYRDQELIRILDHLLWDMGLAGSEWIDMISFLLAKANGMFIRPAHHRILLETLFGEDSAIWKAFNSHDGEMMKDIPVFASGLLQVSLGLRRLYMACSEMGKIPAALESTLHLWLGGYQMLTEMIISQMVEIDKAVLEELLQLEQLVDTHRKTHPRPSKSLPVIAIKHEID